jgi:hypothetical protein
MLRQNHSGGSSTSPSLAKTALLRLAGRPSNSATNNVPGTFSLRNHFSSFPLFRPRFRSQAPLKAPYFFEGTTFPRSFRLRSVAQQRQQIGSPRITALFLEGTTFPPSSGRDWRGRKQAHWVGRGPPHVFRGNHFSSFRWVHGRPFGSRLSPAVFFRSSLQGGSGIPAVPKTGASVLRLLPPTS